RRSAEIRAARPELARQARAWLAAGALLWVALVAIGSPRFRRAAPFGIAWWPATALMLDWHLGMLETEDGRPRPLGAADALTLARAWLVPVVLSAPGPAVCALGAATDVLDGLAARRAEPTRAGRDLEGLVDACFAVAAIVGLRRAGRIGRLPARAELLRLGAGAGYAWFGYLARGEAPDPELIRAARASTAMRAGGLVVAATGRRRLGDALVGAGCLVSLGLLARAVADR
ncbi:MAG TPA: CDP-alcohol phosphatidyltransferase family protein, partial [Solirubrobacteraceae bacterium]|nr:CDP-alcohol phosphatidyltransferase family protein [Solirubrobacteraceae bacterium]